METRNTLQISTVLVLVLVYLLIASLIRLTARSLFLIQVLVELVPVACTSTRVLSQLPTIDWLLPIIMRADNALFYRER